MVVQVKKGGVEMAINNSNPGIATACGPNQILETTACEIQYVI